MAVTAKDVARAAGVSAATVSYVINDHPGQTISAATRQRVLTAVEQLGYLPSEAARALRRGSSDTVLLLMPHLPIGAVVADLIETFTDDLEALGLKVATRRMRPGAPLIDLWVGLRPAAIAVLGGIARADADQVRAAGIPIVGTLLSSSAASGVAAGPQSLIGQLQVQHLAAAGRIALGYAAPDDSRVDEFYRRRLDGVRVACAELGLAEPVVVPVPLDAASAEDAVATWLQAGVTGIACYNDETAFAVLAGMRGLGLGAPRDLAVVGADNIALAALACPPLTTVDQNVASIAAHLAQLIAHELRGAPLPPPLSEMPRLVLRQSA